MVQLTDTHKVRILAYPNANHIMAEIGRKIGFRKSAICKFLSFNSCGMAASSDFAIPRERDQGTETKNKIVTDWQLSIMRIQINKNPSMTAGQLHKKCVSLQNLSIRTIQRCLTEILHRKALFPFIWRLLYRFVFKVGC